MGAGYFNFKQFSIQQDMCAMKVTQVACILGAYASHPSPTSILDIGTGTGLLALMLAQRYTCAIDAIEIDTGAAAQAASNFMNSPWHERLTIHHIDIRAFDNQDKLYDLIVCNPPFYENDHPSTNVLTNLARHSTHLEFKELALACNKLLSEDGQVCIIMPPSSLSRFTKHMEGYHIYPLKYFEIKHQPHSSPKVVICTFSRAKRSIQNEEIIIKDGNGEETQDFRALLKPYYLYL